MPRQTPSRRAFNANALGVLLTVATSGAAHAQAFPSKPITIVIPFPPGGGTDVVFRALTAKLQAALGVPVIIDNRAGAGGTIGTASGAKAAPDGYTLVGATTTTIASAQAVYPKLAYDPVRDLMPITTLGSSPFVLVAATALPVKTLPDLIRYAKQNRGALNYGSIGNGSASYLVAELFKQRAGIELAHVPYRGAGPAQTALMAGEVQLLFDNPTALVQQVRANRMHALAISEPSFVFPDLPTFASQGITDFHPELWYGLMAPANTSKAVVARIHENLRKVLEDPSTKEEMASRGVTASVLSPDAFAKKIRADIELWGGIAKAVGAHVE